MAAPAMGSPAVTRSLFKPMFASTFASAALASFARGGGGGAGGRSSACPHGPAVVAVVAPVFRRATEGPAGPHYRAAARRVLPAPPTLAARGAPATARAYGGTGGGVAGEGWPTQGTPPHPNAYGGAPGAAVFSTGYPAPVFLEGLIRARQRAHRHDGMLDLLACLALAIVVPLGAVVVVDVVRSRRRKRDPS